MIKVFWIELNWIVSLVCLHVYPSHGQYEITIVLVIIIPSLIIKAILIIIEWWCGLLLSVNGPTWFPIIIHLSDIVTILSIYFYWIKLILMFKFWCFACWLLILHKHFIFIHCSASFILTWVPNGLGTAYAADRVWKCEFYLFQFYLTAFYSFWFANHVT